MVSLETLTELIKYSLVIPEKADVNSPKLGLNSIRKFIKWMPTKYKLQLIQDILGYLSFKNLNYLEKNILNMIEAERERAIIQDDFKKWLLEKQESGELKGNLPLKEIDYFLIDITQRQGNFYASLRWFKEGKLYSKHIPNNLLETLPVHLKDNISKRIKELKQRNEAKQKKEQQEEEEQE